MFGRIFRAIWSRQVAKHGSVAALAIGALASALGIPLAPEQISLLLTGFSVLMYVASQLRSLWRPEPPPAAKMLLAACLLGAAAYAAPRAARADQVGFVWLPVTEDVAGHALAGTTGAVDAYGLGCSSTEAAAKAGEFDVATGRVSPDTLSATLDLAPGVDWFCIASVHNSSGWSSPSNTITVRLPVATPPDAPPPVIVFTVPKATVLSRQ